MIIANYEVIAKFAKKHARARSSLNTWYNITLKARWKNFDDLKMTFRSADVYGQCVIFNIGGNNYRLIASINYQLEQVYVLNVLTHAEYDKNKWKGNC
ncbi:MAG: type II toxin-antitoxin system HigB family toxin [Blastocatellia bacterium]|nr:type II toxin-antitoxin system HigB family toxin [Blastocatellia bacterium]